MKITGQRILKFFILKLVEILFLSIPILFLVYVLKYSFENHVFNSIVILYCSYFFRRVFLITVALFLKESDFGGEINQNSMDEKIPAYQAEFIKNYPNVTTYNNVILTISSIIFIIGVIYFTMSTASLMYQ